MAVSLFIFHSPKLLMYNKVDWCMLNLSWLPLVLLLLEILLLALGSVVYPYYLTMVQNPDNQSFSVPFCERGSPSE